MKTKNFLIIALAVLLIFSTGCVEEPSKKPYEGKTCIKCDHEASHSVSGSEDLMKGYGSLKSTNHKKSSVNGIITVYFCDDCFDQLPVVNQPVPTF